MSITLPSHMTPLYQSAYELTRYGFTIFDYEEDWVGLSRDGYTLNLMSSSDNVISGDSVGVSSFSPFFCKSIDRDFKGFCRTVVVD